MALLRAFTLLALFWTGLALADDYAAVTQLMRAGKLTEAQTLADQYLANKPRDPQMRFLKGVIQRDSGKTNDAIGTFTKLTEDYPELPEPYNNLAVLYASQNQYDKARVALEMAIRTNPSYATAHENLGDVYAKLAGQAYNKALQLDSNNNAVTPKFALIRELFNPTGRRADTTDTQPITPLSTTPQPVRPAAVAPVSSAPAYNPPSVSATPMPAPVATPSTRKGVTEMASASSPMITETAPRAAKPAVAERSTERAAERDVGNSDVEAAVKAWAAAWADKDVRGYLAAYGRDFVPPNGMTRGEWEAKREALISGKRSISIKLSKVKVTMTGNKAQVNFVQDYKADSIDSVKPKTLWMAKAGGKWLIVKES